jgi:DNA polymerase-1
MKLIIIDGYGFVFRAFHSLPPLTRADGTAIGAVYGFTNMLLRFIESHQADYIVVALDAGKKTFRNDFYPQYKAHRPPAPPELVVQFPIIREAIAAFGLHTLEQEGFEADDLIASYAAYANNIGIDVMVVSGDKDLMQLIGPGLTLYDPLRNKNVTAEDVKAKFGVQPCQMLDYLALVGDASDNIPGVAGVGAKTASALLQEFGSMQQIYDNLDNIAPTRRQQLLKDGYESAVISKQLVSLKCDLPPAYSIDELSMPLLHGGKLLQFMKDQGFKNLAVRLSKDLLVINPEPIVERVKEIVLSSIKQLQDLKECLSRHEILALYTDSNIFSIAYGNNLCKISLKGGDLFSEGGATYKQCITALADILEDKGIKKVCFDSKTFYKVMIGLGRTIHNIEDIGTMAYSLETGHGNYNLDSVVTRALGVQLNIDAAVLLRAFQALNECMLRDKLFSLYNTIDRPLNQILARMEIKGVKVNNNYLATLSEQFKIKLDELSREIFALAGQEFNIGSPKQLGEMLFVNMGLPKKKQSKSGAYPTGVEVLEELEQAGFSIAGKILQWRQFAKLISTYTDALPKYIDQETGRIHTSFNPTLTATGRLSSQDPNLQNIPIRSPEGNKIRGAFIASPGNILLSADYSQIELRLLAHVAGVDALKEAFLQGKDIHAQTASQLFMIPLAEVDDLMRRRAKAINFGIIYGISPFGLAKNTGVSREVAKNYIEAYFAQYPGIKNYMDETIISAREHGYVSTIFGRRCLIPNINNTNYLLRNFAERAAINAPLQGASADIIKRAMARLGKDLEQYLILQIHDELLFELPIELAASVAAQIKEVMEGAAAISVPLIVDVKIGHSWAEAH